MLVAVNVVDSPSLDRMNSVGLVLVSVAETSLMYLCGNSALSYMMFSSSTLKECSFLWFLRSVPCRKICGDGSVLSTCSQSGVSHLNRCNLSME